MRRNRRENPPQPQCQGLDEVIGLETLKALTQAGVTQAQAETMATLDGQHAADTAQHITAVLRAEIQAIRADFHATVRQQTWAIIAFGFAIAGVAVTVATLLHR